MSFSPDGMTGGGVLLWVELDEGSEVVLRTKGLDTESMQNLTEKIGERIEYAVRQDDTEETKFYVQGVLTRVDFRPDNVEAT